VGADRTHNPFLNTPAGGRVLSALQLPLFMLRPPPSYGVLTTTGRVTRRKRRKCVRAVRSGERVYLVAIKGKTAWLRNLDADPEVTVRIRGGTSVGRARRVDEGSEREEARDAYCEPVGRFERLEYRMWRQDKPSDERIRELHRTWFETGTPVVIELS
jgi:deazaflavin-dependent oxidoreductase (nitroreductase family)